MTTVEVMVLLDGDDLLPVHAVVVVQHIRVHITQSSLQLIDCHLNAQATVLQFLVGVRVLFYLYVGVAQSSLEAGHTSHSMSDRAVLLLGSVQERLPRVLSAEGSLPDALFHQLAPQDRRAVDASAEGVLEVGREERLFSRREFGGVDVAAGARLCVVHVDYDRVQAAHAVDHVVNPVQSRRKNAPVIERNLQLKADGVGPATCQSVTQHVHIPDHDAEPIEDGQWSR
mmetsp:Transcript_39518/g.91762  ORF Transcript_39518/g.91762 Transcript_39518/m.91762 type:complete len:228 (+) Transcript_39518:356-1039(+)